MLVLELTRHGDTTMVPLLLAVGGASVTAARLDHRSLYSARAHPAEGGDGAVSAASPLSAVVARLVTDGRPVVVAADDGTIIGEVGPSDVDVGRYRPMPAEAVTAGDVAGRD